MIKRLQLLLFLLISSSISLKAQAEIGDSPVKSSIDMFPKNPEAAALSKFVDIPAGNYTGVADFTIPLYTIEFDGQKIPIQLRYTTTGVTVGQIATRVGLGWVLSAGPSLSQQVIGNQDRVFPREILPANFNPVDNTQHHELATRLAGLVTGESPIDIQPDIFTYDLIDTNGKFVLNAAGTSGVPMPYNQTKIITVNGSLYDIDITDEQGFLYKFVSPNLSITNNNSCTNSIGGQSDFDDPNYKIIRIVSPKNQEINFLYDPNSLYNISSKYITSLSTRERIQITGNYIHTGPGAPYPPFPRQCINYATLREKPLTEIQFSEGKVIFIYNTTNPRQDLVGDVYLTQVLVKNKKDQVIKNFSFNYDYFDSTEKVPSNTFLNHYSTYLQGADKRLKLISVVDNLTNGKYKLEYYESFAGKNLPHRISNNQDFWGVYNGKNNGEKSISYSNSTFQSPYIGADKKPDINYGKLGNLWKITYPTGGYTEINYEADESDISDNPIIIYDYSEEEKIFDADDSNTQYNKVLFTIEEGAPLEKTLVFNGRVSSPGNPLPANTCVVNLRKTDGTINYTLNSSNVVTRYDPPGDYELWIKPDTSMYPQSCSASYSWKYITKTPIETLNSLKTGTIRVNKIESFDQNNGKITREYTYKEPTQNHILPYTKSSGVNLGEVAFSSLSVNKYPKDSYGHYIQELIASNNPGWQTTTVKGKPIGYSFVQEHYVDHTNPNNSYRKEYEFQNDISSYANFLDPNGLTIMWPVDGLDRGLLKEELLFNSSNQKVKQTNKSYQYDRHFNTKYSNNTNGSMENGIQLIATELFGLKYTFAYTTFPLTNTWIREDSVRVRDYINGVNFIETIKTNNYSIPAYKHTYPTESVTEGSGGILKTMFKYPQDLTASQLGTAQSQSVLDLMINKNQLSDPLIVKSYKNNIVNSEIRTLYEAFNTNVSGTTMPLPRYIYLKKGENAVEGDRKITFDSYDTYGNLTQYTLENGVPVSVIWGYNKTKPIAKIEGAKLSGILTWLIDDIVNQSNADNNYSPTVSADQTEQNLLSSLDNFRQHYSLAAFQITTYTYDPLVGVRSVTPPSGLTEYYSYDTAGRLKDVKRTEKDTSGNDVLRVLKKNEYHYQQQP